MIWFRPSNIEGESVFASTNNYWDEKIKGNWSECDDIF
jgi:hypothetical protein